jgi:23S rRNA (uracil1939-C5)-methyltransferase
MIHKKGDILELTIDDLAFGGRGVARLNDFVWFVKQGIPGQKVSAKITKIKKGYGEARVHEIISPSPDQVSPPCPYFGICGGCQFQHLEYEKQVEYKTKQVKELLERIGSQKQIGVRPTIPATDIYGYRNKMEFTYSNRRWLIKENDNEQSADFALGLHVPNRYDKVLNIDACLLQSEKANRLLKEIGELTAQSRLSPYSTATHQGFWRFLVIREGKNTGDLMVNIITSDQNLDEGKKEIDRFVHKLFWSKRGTSVSTSLRSKTTPTNRGGLKINHPELTTLLHSVCDQKAQVAFGKMERLLLGPGKITERICERIFDISPNAFFQTNTKQTQILFDTISELADFQGDETVYDLYCGTGAIGIYIADRVKQVIGIEVIESAVADGKHNIELNEIHNIELFQSDMKDALQKSDLAGKYGTPDVVILDPPRGGPHPKTLKGLLDLAPPKIIYVSCNPPILSRDLQILCEEMYICTTVQPVDMFPHTGHIEVVAVLKKKS